MAGAAFREKQRVDLLLGTFGQQGPPVWVPARVLQVLLQAVPQQSTYVLEVDSFGTTYDVPHAAVRLSTAPAAPGSDEAYERWEVRPGPVYPSATPPVRASPLTSPPDRLATHPSRHGSTRSRAPCFFPRSTGSRSAPSSRCSRCYLWPAPTSLTSPRWGST